VQAPIPGRHRTLAVHLELAFVNEDAGTDDAGAAGPGPLADLDAGADETDEVGQPRFETLADGGIGAADLGDRAQHGPAPHRSMGPAG